MPHEISNVIAFRVLPESDLNLKNVLSEFLRRENYSVAEKLLRLLVKRHRPSKKPYLDID